jgi:hypothetical protein
MDRRDRIDATLAKHFAWSFARAGVVADLEERLRAARGSSPPPLPSDEAAGLPAAPFERDEGALEVARGRARKACAALAVAVERAWAIADEGEGVRAAKRLLVRAERLDHLLAGFDEKPELAVRLVRLFVRYGPKMTQHQRERAAQVAALLPLDDPEVADLLVEVARAGDREMTRALLADDEWAPELGDELALAARLADVIEAAPSHAGCVVAIDVLSLLGEAARATAAPALRRSLDAPSLTVRGHALHALLMVEPCPLVAADLVPTLRQLALHALPAAFGEEEREEDERILADALLASIARVRPPEAEEALLDLIDAEHDALWLDAAWATEALAVAFPDTAAATVDYWLGCAGSPMRMRALGALSRLPDDLAAPRLAAAASDPAFGVRDAVRRQWLERFARACPAGPSDLVGASLLEGPPSEAFSARLAVMQGRVQAARLTMARALLAELPDREALVLLLQLLGDDSDSHEPTFAGRPASDTWAARIVGRFGAPGVAGLCSLASRFPEPETFGWMRRLGDLIEQGVIAPEHCAPVRELAARSVTSADGGRVDDALRVLALVGAPPDLLEPVLALALDDDPATSQARGLVVSWRDRGLDARLVSEMEGALVARDWGRLERAAAVALRRGSQPAFALASRVLDAAEHEEDAVDAAVECARRLRERGTLGDAWAAQAIARPDSPLFAVAARAWWRSPVLRAGLEAALGSTARGGASAVEAAVGLLHGDPPLSPRDRRLPRLLERSTLEGRARLVGALCVHGVPGAVILPYLEALMLSSDPSITSELTGVAVVLKSPRSVAWLRGILPLVVDPDLAAEIEESIGGVPESFWQER